MQKGLVYRNPFWTFSAIFYFTNYTLCIYMSIVYCLLSIVYVYLLWFTKALYFWRKEVEDPHSPRNVFFWNVRISCCLPITMFMCLSVYRQQCPCVCISIDTNVCVYVCLSIPMSVCLSVYQTNVRVYVRLPITM